jgi:hypothetical protein
MRLSEHLYLLFFFITGLMACKSGIQYAMPEIKDADSATIIYYNKPPDTRFFKVVKGKKPRELETIIEDVNTSAQKNAEASCESIGKIYFYKGTEQVYVVYFSDKSCSKLAFIKNGLRYESEMSEASFKLLNEWKAKATEPTSK